MKTYEFIIKGASGKGATRLRSSGWINANNKSNAEKRLKKIKGVRYVKLREETRKHFKTTSWVK